jgi:hypothetical protein
MGCTSRTVGWKKEVKKISLSKQEMEIKLEKARENWKKRHIKDQLEAFIVKFEHLSRSIGSNRIDGVTFYEICEYLARAYYILADSHYKKLNLKKKYWEVGAAWAERGLSINRKFRKAVDDDGKLVAGLKYLQKNEAGALYWYLANVGQWAKNSGIATTLKYKSLIIRMANRVQQLNPEFYYAGIFRYWGAFFSVMPNYAGGSLEKSLKNFDKSLELSPDYLGTKLLMASLYTVKAGKRDQFTRILREILKAPLNRVSEIYPENYLVKKKARRLLEEVEFLF